MQQIISREDAITQGLTVYFTGQPCKNNHISIRYVKTWKCKECNKEKRNRWVSRYPSKMKDYKKNYYQQNSLHHSKKVKQWRINNADKVKVMNKINKANRRALELQATVRWANKKKIADMYANCPAGYHVDHIVPLNSKIVCGLHNEFNLQYLPKSENLSKGNKFIIL